MQHKETVVHLITGCNKLVATDYTKRHNSVVFIFCKWTCAKYDLKHKKEWWVEPEKVVGFSSANGH